MPTLNPYLAHFGSASKSLFPTFMRGGAGGGGGFRTQPYPQMPKITPTTPPTPSIPIPPVPASPSAPVPPQPYDPATMTPPAYNPGLGNPYFQTSPNFQDIIARLNQPIAGRSTFEQGIAAGASPTGFDPAYQAQLDNIRANADFYGKQAASQAQSLAAKRGITGSSTEQFGTQTALQNVNRTAADQEAAVRLQELQRRQVLQDAAMKAYLGRADTEAQFGTQQNVAGANLTSDEIASLRNAQFGQQQLELQKLLGEQGIAAGRENIASAEDIAKRNAQYGLIGSIGGAVLPGLLFGGGGGAGGGLGGLLGGGNGGLFSGLGASLGGTAGQQVASGATQYVPGIGMVSTPGAAAAGFTPGIGSVAAAGLGAMALSGAAENYGKQFGQTVGNVAGTLANPIGKQLNVAKDLITNPGKTVGNVAKSVTVAPAKAVASVGKKVSKSIKKAFPF